MKKVLNDKLIVSIKNAMSENTNLATYLANLLSLGKESVYRRIRGDVSFDLEELAEISKALGISIDNILGKKETEAIYSVDIPQFNNLIEQYCGLMDFYSDTLIRMKAYSNPQIEAAYNELPFLLYLPYENLSKFQFYKSMYQVQTSTPNIPFSDFHLPQKVADKSKRYIDESRNNCHVTITLSQNTFSSLIDTIVFFGKLNLLSQSDISQLRTELLLLLEELEIKTINGVWNDKLKFNLYTSSIDFDASYAHLSCSEFQLSTIKAFSLNVIRSFMPEVCKEHKEWIDSLKRYSMLISQSGDIYRAEFFNKQRKFVNSLSVFLS